MELFELRKSIESFLQEMRKEYYLHSAGLKDELELNRIYSRYPGLFNEKNLSVIKDSYSRSDTPEDIRKRKLLMEAYYSELLSVPNKDLSEEFYKRESSGIIKLEKDKEVSYRSSQIFMMNEVSRDKRSLISDNRDRFKEKQLNPLLETIFKNRETAIGRYGYKNEIDMFHKLSDIDLFGLDGMMQEFLVRSEDLYVRELEQKLKNELGLKLSEVERHDVAFLNRAREYDGLFPGGKVIRSSGDFIKGVGLDPTANGRITYDLEPREKKSPRAFCCPVKIPEEIILVIYPRGGEDDFTAFMHELGHAMHYAYVDPSLDMEYKWFGDSSVTEGFAMTFEYLVLNELWIKKFLGSDSADYEKYIKHAAMNQLMILRRYAGKLHYEIQLYQTPGLTGKAGIYRNIMTDATKIKYSETDYLLDVDNYFYCANYLRAWIFQSQLRRGLADRFGNKWFERKESGDFLKELWNTGQKHNADELLQQNGFGKLSPDMLIGELEGILGN